MSEPIRLYRPSNGTDGEFFQAKFCYRCWKDSPARMCGILSRMMLHDIDEPEYPNEVRYVDGEPTCTAFQSKDAPRVKAGRHDAIVATRDKNSGQGRMF